MSCIFLFCFTCLTVKSAISKQVYEPFEHCFIVKFEVFLPLIILQLYIRKKKEKEKKTFWKYPGIAQQRQISETNLKNKLVTMFIY